MNSFKFIVFIFARLITKLVVQKDIFVYRVTGFWIASCEAKVDCSRCSTKYNATEYPFLRCCESLS